jgi:hypothetical protein
MQSITRTDQRGAPVEAVTRKVHRSAVERVRVMTWNIDFPWVGWVGNTATSAAVTVSTDREGQVGWWRERLQEQGHALDQIERLIAQYREAAWRSGPASPAGGGP